MSCTRARIRGTHRAVPNFITGASFPDGVAVNAGHIYWANNSSALGAIGRANLDGTGVVQTFIGASVPTGVAIGG